MSKTLRALGLSLCLLGAGCASPGSNRADEAPEYVGIVVLEAIKALSGWVVIP